MGKCSLCGKEIQTLTCEACGYDESRNYERFSTLCPIAPGAASLAQQKRKMEAARTRYRMTTEAMGKHAVDKFSPKKGPGTQAEEGPKCWCCGTRFYGPNCPNCNFIAIRDDDPDHAELIRGLARKHRQQILGELTDFSVVTYNYQWDHKAGKMTCAGEERKKLADGLDCQEIFWSEPIFGQLEAGTPVPITLSYRYQGVKHQLELEIPAVRSDGFWQIGLCIDAELRLVVFLGDPTHFQTVKAELKLK